MPYVSEKIKLSEIQDRRRKLTTDIILKISARKKLLVPDLIEFYVFPT